MSAYTLRRDADELPELALAGYCRDCGTPLRDGRAGNPSLPHAAYSRDDLTLRCPPCFALHAGGTPLPAPPPVTHELRMAAQATALRRTAGWCLSCGWPATLPAHNAHSTLCSCPKGTP